MEQKNSQNSIFIVSEPTEKLRLIKLISEVFPGLLLVLSVAGSHPEIIGTLLLNVFCIIAGTVVIIFAIRAFLKKASVNKSRTDMVNVMAGLLLIAQGSLVYNAYRDFQPSHFYFIAAFVLIFKGVMFPESKIKRGFTISDEEIIYTSSPYKAPVKIVKENLETISLEGNRMYFRYLNGTVKIVKLWGVENPGQLNSELKAAIFNQL